MQKNETVSFHSQRCKVCTFLLALGWLFGLLFGSFLAAFHSVSYVSLMRTAINAGVSIVGFLGVIFLPFLLTAFAVYFELPFLLPLFCFCKALFWSFTGCLSVLAFGSAGWLVRFLFLFTDSASLPFLIYLWLLGIRKGREGFWPNFWFCLLGVGIVAVVDHLIVSPLLALLI